MTEQCRLNSLDAQEPEHVQRASRSCSSKFEDVVQTTFQAFHDLLESAQRDALFAAFQTIERGRGQAKSLGKLGVREFAAPLAQELSELAFERHRHAGSLADELFRMWNISDLTFTAEDRTESIGPRGCSRFIGLLQRSAKQCMKPVSSRIST